jgi:predicted aconitase
MNLTDDEKRMLDGEEGKAVQKAMDLLVRYGDVLGAERFVDTDNVCGANIFGPRQSAVLNSTDPAQLFSQFSLDSDETLDVPPVRAHSCQLIGPMDTIQWEEQGVSQETHDDIMESEEYSAVHGINLLNTCTPYQVGIVPLKGEHCAWMESSAVIYINSVLGARTNTEGRESTAAAMLTGKIPYWGFHTDEHRRATHHVRITCDVSTEQDWGVLGYFVGEAVGDGVPVLTGQLAQPQLKELKHFGASAASAGDVEMYHIPGLTSEANTLEEALGGRPPEVELEFGIEEWRRAYEHLNSTGHEEHIDLVMLGCPHANLDQIREICRKLDGRKVADGTTFWVFTPRAIREVAERNGHGAAIRAAGGQLMSDTCPAMGVFVPPGTKAFCTDSAKQVHYLPAIKDVEGWFGSTQECVDAAITGRWEGRGR